ncbi:uncharacterized protein DUF3105 [Saccharopolyspora erythraea NRRL 2338]|uniref:Uncharacterized protein n=2 Tax=Saccharopolyspora erythraea TaxID=1836 RepID=A4FN48_SACEN|nr:DUF3105 domain-containing protein [Saccharopolyspora erythraea]EQD83054.1 hypothetical protein N599_27270 [Saccharopolyspora erythraea D]PFG99114.1 uncharacterized protein DUF3105 [Saccharopolyspora erythraea NRRL 2338]QRK89073.1 DUF3105 domain-containing protein [Saccharopolyspora erythraea]CAM05473.1 hypothetical protein SACE_6301 [Saccharopolyspora erythraea NRRL 2338]
MANGKKNKAVRGARGSVVQQRSIPWVLIAGVTVVLIIAGVVFGYVGMRAADKQALAVFTPSQQNPDPSKAIPGVQLANYPAQQHVTQAQRVAYDQNPPFGGPHDGIWADCTGVVYPQPVRTENMVHSLEHGAVWIAYDPAKVDAAGVEELGKRVEGKPYTMMSPYPGMDSPISVQSWGHRLKVDKADDQRIDQFITALRQNGFGVYPEIGGSCQAYPGAFDTLNPPPFDPAPAPPGSVPMDGTGSQQATGEMGAGQ